jgi:glycosyltransferase involved in cell wall biosynthesis
MDSCSIIIATYGDNRWKKLAEERAYPSVKGQKANEIIISHEPLGTAASCKNNAIREAKSKWIAICDADDELEDGYVESALQSPGDLRYPRVRYIPPDFSDPLKDGELTTLTRRHLLMGNYMVIGTLFEKERFLQVGGFSEFESWEDWYLFMQLNYLGAVPVLCEQSVYRVYRHPVSRVTVPNPTKLFLSMRDCFRQWALKFNNGVTTDESYYRFIHPSMETL